MALTRQQKEQSISSLQESVSAAASVVFLSHNGLTVAEVSELRGKLAETGGGMRVIPKRLLKIALSNLKLNFDPTQHEGQLAVVWGDDTVAPAKTLNTFAEDHEGKIQFLAGTLEGSLLSVEEVTQLAHLPTRQELLGQLANVLSAGPRGLVTVLSGVQRSTVNVLKAIADQKS